MDSFWKFFVKKKSFTFLLMLSLVLAGIFSVVVIPKESSPEVDAPFIVVSTVLPGASAGDVEQLVTKKIEDQLNSALKDIKEITSTSRQGFSSIFVEFDADVDIETRLQEARSELEKISSDLPDDATSPQAAEFDFSNQPVVTFSISSDAPLTELVGVSEEIKRELKGISGVSEVSVSGVREKEVQVVVSRDALLQYGISLGQVVGGISAANSSVPVGSITIEGIQYAINFEGDIATPFSVKDIPIFERGGVPVYIRDVAFVSDGVGGATSFSRISSNKEEPRQAMSFAVFKRTGSDVTKVAKAVREKLEELQKEGGILEGESVVYSFDIGKDVQNDLVTLSVTGLQTVFLVVLILLFALGTREAVIAGLAIPISFLIAFIGLNGSGNTLNFVSLFSLILAVGILVDSAIVITEGMHTKIDEGVGRRNAALFALEELSWPVIAGTMTTIAVFAPLFFLSGITGEFIKSIPFTIVFVLLASLFVALGFVPIIAATFLKKKNGDSPWKTKQENATKKLRAWYKKKLKYLIESKNRRHKFYWVLTILLVIAISLPVTGAVRAVFFEDDDQPYVFVDIELDQGTTLIETDLVTREVERIVGSENDVESYITSVGSLSAFGAGGGESSDRYANITLILKKKREMTSIELSDHLARIAQKEIPNATIKTSVLSGGPPTSAPIEMQFLGDSFDDLNKAVLVAQNILSGLDGTRDIETNQVDDGLDFVIHADREKVAEVGLDVATIAGTLRTAVFGVKATTIRTDTDDIDVSVRLDLNPDFVDVNRSVNTTIDEIRNIPLPTKNGLVLLGSLVDVEIEKSNALINHIDLKRAVTVTSQLESEYNPIQTLSEFKKRLAEVELPAGVEVAYGGETADTNQSFAEMGIALVVGIIFIFSILVLQFNSFRQSFIIISIALFIIIGVFFGLFFSGQPISFPSMMGFIAVVGIAVNNSIILIDVMNRLKQEKGLSTLDRVLKGAESRLRPILLTTLTTVIGIIPLTYASALWSPLAFAILFGLSFTTIITLFLVPALEYGGLADFGYRLVLTFVGLGVLGGIMQVIFTGILEGLTMFLGMTILFALIWLLYRRHMRNRFSKQNLTAYQRFL